jgi:hypothetical protein
MYPEEGESVFEAVEKDRSVSSAKFIAAAQLGRSHSLQTDVTPRISFFRSLRDGCKLLIIILSSSTNQQNPKKARKFSAPLNYYTNRFSLQK